MSAATDQDLLAHRLIAIAERLAALEHEIALLGVEAANAWSGPGALRFSSELRQRRAALVALRSDLSTAARQV